MRSSPRYGDKDIVVVTNRLTGNKFTELWRSKEEEVRLVGCIYQYAKIGSNDGVIALKSCVMDNAKRSLVFAEHYRLSDYVDQRWSIPELMDQVLADLVKSGVDIVFLCEEILPLGSLTEDMMIDFPYVRKGEKES